MANKYWNGPDADLETVISTLGMADQDSLIVQGGSTVTCTQSPSIFFSYVYIRDGVFHIDGVGAANPIIFVGEYSRDFRIEGLGELRITGDWWELGVSDGSANQTFDCTPYFAGSPINMDVFPGLWIETGRRITYNNQSGVDPKPGDWIFKSNDHFVHGPIESVGNGYVVVRFLIGSLNSGDSIEVHSIQDNKGPAYQKSWAATVTGNTLEPDVFQGFPNAYQNNTDHLASCGNTISGLCFSHNPDTGTITFGDGTNGVIPPNGARIRIPNVMICNSTAAKYALGEVSYDTSLSGRFGIYTALGGSLDCDKFVIASGAFEDANATSASFKHGTSMSGIGIRGCLGPLYYEDLVFSSNPKNNGLARYGFCPTIMDQVEPVTAKKIIYSTFDKIGKVGADASKEVTLVDITKIGNNASGGIVFTNTQSIDIDGLVVSGTRAQFQDCADVSLKNYKCQAHNDPSQHPVYDMLYMIRAAKSVITGWEVLNGGYPEDSMLVLTDCSDIKVRGFHWADDKLSCSQEFLQVYGVATDIDIARVWVDNVNPNEFALTPVGSMKGFTVTNCSGSYSGEIEVRSIDTVYNGLHGGSGNFNATDGVEVDYTASYGADIQSIFRSDTTGAFVWVGLPGSTGKPYQIISGSPRFEKNGRVNMEPGDVFIVEQSFTAYGHTGFTGVTTRNRSSGSIADGTNEWGTKVTCELQYDLGSGWNGSWIDIDNAAALQGIPSFEAGIRLKLRFTCNASIADMNGLMVHTTTSIQAQMDNLVPIDQLTVPITIKVVDIDTNQPVQGARIRVVAASGGPASQGSEIFQAVTGSSGVAILPAYNFISDQPVSGWVRQGTTPPYYKEGKIIGTITSNGLDVTVPLVRDD